MSTLYLIRHGQASFMKEDYDVLSPLGERQAQRLGAYWANRGLALDALFTGPRKRQRDTADHMIQAARAGGTSLPAPILIEELDEYPAFEILKRCLPMLQERDPVFQQRFGPLQGGSGTGGADFKKQFQRVYAYVFDLWTKDALDLGDLERWETFLDRVSRGLGRISQQVGRGARAAAVTSGGPISAALKRTLGLDAGVTMKTASVIANSAVTEFLFRDEEWTLMGFNAFPHLTDLAEVTFR